MPPPRLGALALGSWLWVPQAPAQVLCPPRWTYQAPATTAYISAPFVSDAAGSFFWREGSPVPELVAVRDGTMRWRRPLDPRAAGALLSAALMADGLLVVAQGSRVEGRRTSDGRVVWSRDLGGAISAVARVGRALVAVSAGRATAAWLTAISASGKRLWRTPIAGPVARLAADGDRLYVLPSVGGIGTPAIIVVDSAGFETVDARIPFRDSLAVTGGEVVFGDGRVVAAVIAPMSWHCPPRSPSCHPPPSMLTIMGFSAGQERWRLTSFPAGLRAQILLLSDSSVLVVDGPHVGSISSDGHRRPLCDLPAASHRSVAGLVHGDLVLAYGDRVAAYSVPGAPRLAATGWVMSGGGPAQDWAPRAAAPSRASRWAPFPSGVADPDANVAYVQGDGGVTMALSLADGTVSWSTPGPARPVGLWNGRVLVLERRDTLASALRVTQLDPSSGAVLGESQAVPLAGSVPFTLAPWGEPLTTDVRIAGDRVHLGWVMVVNGGSGGADIRPFVESGAADIDLASGSVSLTPTRQVEGGQPIATPRGRRAAIVDGRTFTLDYGATATLTATSARTGARLWSRRLWAIEARRADRIPPP